MSKNCSLVIYLRSLIKQQILQDNNLQRTNLLLKTLHHYIKIQNDAFCKSANYHIINWPNPYILLPLSIIIKICIMSRRLRTKSRTPKDKFGRNHHVTYSTSSTHFPTSYSIFGRPVGFPATILPFMQNDNLNFCGSIQQFNATCQQYERKDPQKQQTSKLSSAQMVNISIEGDIIQEHNPFATGLIFVCTMICVLPFMLFKTSCFRQRFFTKYRFESYNNLAQFIRKLKSTKTLILNFQDNFFDDSKAEILERALVSTQIKDITLRNNSYWIKCNCWIKCDCAKSEKYFPTLRSSKTRQFKFIWEQQVFKNWVKKEEEQGLVFAELNLQQ